MPPLTADADELSALDEGRAAVDLSAHRKVLVRGGDARRWLHDLLTTNVASLQPGQGRRSLLLDPSGHIRADVQVACDEDGFWLFQAPDQPDHVGAALTPYVLSADVRLDDRTASLSLLALPGPPEGNGFRPSTLGDGRDLLVDASAVLPLPPGRRLVGAGAVEVQRIRLGRARMGADFDRSSIPAEARLESTIDAEKGCFLGQESVARVRALGHPPRTLRHLRADAPIDARSPVLAGGPDAVGVVTSSARSDAGGSVLLASVRWDVDDGRLHTPDGVPLNPVGSLD
jgi:hypothetical protein